jgi:hypothetical protein
MKNTLSSEKFASIHGRKITDVFRNKAQKIINCVLFKLPVKD